MSLIMTSAIRKSASFICFWFQRVEKNLHRSALTFGPGERTSNCSEFVTFSEDKKRERLCVLDLNSNQPNSPRTPPLPSRRVLYERQSAGTEYVSSKQINSDSSCARWHVQLQQHRRSKQHQPQARTIGEPRRPHTDYPAALWKSGD
jgi:hypothetical protein